MKNQLKNLQEKIKRESADKSDKSGDSQLSDDKSGQEAGNSIDKETVLKRGKNFIRPLKMSPKRALKLTAIIVAVLLISIASLFAVLIYRYQSDSDFVYGASRILPYPAARVNGQFISYHEYLFELRTFKRYYENPIAGGEEGIDFSSPEGQEQLESLRNIAMAEAQRKAVIEQIASDRGVKVTKQEKEEKLNEFIESEGGREQLEEAINDFYGWTMRDFEKIIHIQLLQMKIVEQRAESVLDKVEAGEDFAELARENSSDGSAEAGGDVGWTGENQFVQEFTDAAEGLEVGETSGLVQTQFGYHILKAMERDEEKGVRVSHILIDPSALQSEIDRRLSEAKISNYIGVSTQDEEPALEEAEPQSQPEEQQQPEE